MPFTGSVEPVDDLRVRLSPAGTDVYLPVAEADAGFPDILRAYETLEAWIDANRLVRWYISLTVEIQREVRTGPSPRQSAGGPLRIDLGVKHLATLSTGEHVPNPRHGRAAGRRLAATQRAVARCAKGSGRRRRAVARLPRLHARVGNLRTNATDQLTSRLIHDHAVIGVEDLNVAGMTRSSRGTIEAPGKRVRQKSGLNRSVLDASFATIRWLLECKAKWYGAKVGVVDRFAPSSKTCSACGAVKTKLTLAERTFNCDACGLVEDRDLNAARNLAAWAAAEVQGGDDAPSAGESENARREPVRPASPGVVGAAR